MNVLDARSRWWWLIFFVPLFGLVLRFVPQQHVKSIGQMFELMTPVARLALANEAWKRKQWPIALAMLVSPVVQIGSLFLPTEWALQHLEVMDKLKLVSSGASAVLFAAALWFAFVLAREAGKPLHRGLEVAGGVAVVVSSLAAFGVIIPELHAVGLVALTLAWLHVARSEVQLVDRSDENGLRDLLNSLNASLVIGALSIALAVVIALSGAGALATIVVFGIAAIALAGAGWWLVGLSRASRSNDAAFAMWAGGAWVVTWLSLGMGPLAWSMVKRWGAFPSPQSAVPAIFSTAAFALVVLGLRARKTEVSPLSALAFGTVLLSFVENPLAAVLISVCSLVGFWSIRQRFRSR